MKRKSTAVLNMTTHLVIAPELGLALRPRVYQMKFFVIELFGRQGFFVHYVKAAGQAGTLCIRFAQSLFTS